MATLCDWVNSSDNSSQHYVEQLFVEAKNLLIQTAQENDKAIRETKQDNISGLLSTCITRLNN